MNFEENVSEWYTVASAVENEWLNEKLENFNYGKYYSVNFQGNAESYLWQTKEAPEVGKKYYGHIERAKSGKSMRFKKDKVPEGGEVPAKANEKQASFGESPEKQAHISRSVALNNAVAYLSVLEDKKPNAGGVLKLADTFLEWLNPQQDQLTKDITTLFSEKDAPEWGDDEN